MKFENPISSRVIRGSAVPKPANTFANVGMTQIFTITMATAMAATTNEG